MALGRMPAVSRVSTTAGTPAALTVAGQWRIFTAFPNILVSLSDLGTQAAETPAQKEQKAGWQWGRFALPTCRSGTVRSHSGQSSIVLH